MTDVSTDHPGEIPYIELTDEGRKISFRRDVLGEVKIYRKVNDGDWELQIERTSTPYIDSESFKSGTNLSYAIELEQGNKTHKYTLDVML